MHSVNLDQLADTEQLKTWLKAGETVELREQETVLARIVPEENPDELEVERPAHWPDFAARRRAIFGDQILPGADLLIEERENSRY